MTTLGHQGDAEVLHTRARDLGRVGICQTDVQAAWRRIPGTRQTSISRLLDSEARVSMFQNIESLNVLH
jgi:hypothetical protein